MIFGFMVACACGGLAQSGGTSDTYGMAYPDIMNGPMTPGVGPSISSVDSSVSNALSGDTPEASPSATSISEPVSAVPVGSLSGGGRSSALGGIASSFNESKSAWAETGRAGASEFSTSGFSASAGDSPKSLLSAGSSLPTLGPTKRTARLSSPAGQALLFRLGAMGEPSQNATAAATSNQRQALSMLSGKMGAAIDGGEYASDFPDSTKNTGVISPPDLGNVSRFAFSPEISSELPDFSQREFLKPTFHVGLESQKAQQTEDAYERLERRLKEYRESGTKSTAVKNGLKPNHLGSSSLKNPYARRQMGGGLKESKLGITP